MKLSELIKQMNDLLAGNGDVEVRVSPETCGFEGEDFRVMVIDDEPPEMRAYLPDDPYWLYFDKTKKAKKS